MTENRYGVIMAGRSTEGSRDIVVVTALSVIFSVFSVYVHFSERIYRHFISSYSAEAFEYLVNFVLLYLAGLLLVIYRRWRRAHRKQKELESIISSISPDTLIAIDKDRTVTICNPSVERMFGYGVDEVINKKTDLLYSDRRADPARYHEIHDVLEREGFHVGFAAGRRKDGRDISLEIISAHLSNDQGAVLLLRDITDRVKAREEQRESERKYRKIFDNAIEGIFQSTPEGRFLMANPALARMYGYASAEDLVASVTSIAEQVYVAPARYEEFKRLLEENGEITDFEVQLKKRDNSPFWVSMNAKVIHDENGSVLYYEGTSEDVTVRKEAEGSLKQSLERLRKSTLGVIDVIALAVEARDPYTAGHQRRVADLAKSIAEEMGLPEKEVSGLYMGGVIHDLGKISIPAEILSMPRKLSVIEHDLVRTHSQAGYDMLKDVDFPYPIAQIVLQHHEKLDGSGYPQGLKADDIMVEAKILAVADVVEAIASHRPYRPARGIDVALDEISQKKGILYEPEVVDTCIRLFKEKGYRFS